MPPKPARFKSSHFWASSLSGGALVMRQMFSSWRPWAWRSKRAACAARGKQTCSGQTGRVRIERLTLRSFSYWKVRYCVGVGCQGGEIRPGGGEQFLDVLVEFGLVVFDGQQIVRPAFQHEIASGFGLGVEGIQRDQSASRSRSGKSFAPRESRWSWCRPSRCPSNTGWARRRR